MKDVSCRAIRKFTQMAQALGIDTNSLLSNFRFDRKFLLGGFNHVDWATFDAFTRKLERIVGGREAMMELCAAETTQPKDPKLAALLGWAVSPRLLYRVLGAVMLPMNYPCVKITFGKIGDGHMQFRIRCPGGDCLPALHLGVGCFRIAPRWIGNTDAEVQPEFGKGEAVYTVKLPPNRTFFARVARSISILFSGKTAVKILSAQATKLKRDYFHLERVEQELERRVATATHEEQKRIAADMQIQLGGKLRKIHRNFACLRDQLSPLSPKGMEDAVEVCCQLRDAIRMTEDLASGLDPISLHGESLKRALDHLALQTKNLCGVACEFQDIGSHFEFDHVSSVNLYRLTQEAINNAIKHGMARRIQILMASADDIVSLTITDDGSGINELPKYHDGRGTKIMDYRAKLIGGELRLESEPGKSTSVSCVIKRTKDPESYRSNTHRSFLPPGEAVTSRPIDL